MPNKKSSLRDQVRARIREAGLRCTMARVHVLEQLYAATTPLSHADLAATLSREGFDKATIYRNLVELADSGIVSRMELGDHVWRFELKRPEKEHSDEHPHFVCVECGEVSCLTGVSVNVSPAPASKGSVIGEVTQVLLKGRCDRCV
jgi:Fur family ferric uptake transcriptional regulator